MFGTIAGWFGLAWVKAALVAAALAALAVGYFAWADHIGNVRETAVRAVYDLAIAKQKIAAAKLLADETAKTRAVETKLNAALAAQEKTDAQNAQTVAGLRADLRRKSRAAGGPGLHDPNAAGCGGGSGGTESPVATSADSGAADPAQAGGLLSEPLEQLLLRITSEADDINVAYASCRQDSMNIRAAAPP